METGLLHAHNIGRWLVILFLVITLVLAISKSQAIRSTSLWLLIFSHIMFLIGTYQLVAGRYGILKGLPEGVSLMKDKFFRFYWIEHPLLMLISIILITIARSRAKVLNYRRVTWLLLIALVLIAAAVPWPFREVVGRPYFPAMGE